THRRSPTTPTTPSYPSSAAAVAASHQAAFHPAAARTGPVVRTGPAADRTADPTAARTGPAADRAADPTVARTGPAADRTADPTVARTGPAADRTADPTVARTDHHTAPAVAVDTTRLHPPETLPTPRNSTTASTNHV